MTVRTIKTNEAEANRIADNKLHFVIRSNKDYFNDGDLIEFQVYRNKRPVTHRIDKMTYVVTAVMSNNDAPINDGYQLIDFRRLA